MNIYELVLISLIILFGLFVIGCILYATYKAFRYVDIRETQREVDCICYECERYNKEIEECTTVRCKYEEALDEEQDEEELDKKELMEEWIRASEEDARRLFDLD